MSEKFMICYFEIAVSRTMLNRASNGLIRVAVEPRHFHAEIDAKDDIKMSYVDFKKTQMPDGSVKFTYPKKGRVTQEDIVTLKKMIEMTLAI